MPVPATELDPVEATPVVLTIDNLGEARAIERGTWDGSHPLGADPSVTIALPRLLHELAALRLRATFFVEAINVELNPTAVGAIVGGGHELAIHGWRHEAWGELPGDREHELLARCRRACEAHDLDPVGFRPPGGALAAADPGALAVHGFRWCSPELGAVPDGSGATDRLAWVPFAWELVDAFWLMDSFAERRLARGAARDALPAPAAGRELWRRLTRSDPARPPGTVVLHPFLMLDDDWWAQTRDVLARLSAGRERGELTILTAGDAVSAGVRYHP